MTIYNMAIKLILNLLWGKFDRLSEKIFFTPLKPHRTPPFKHYEAGHGVMLGIHPKKTDTDFLKGSYQ